MYKQTAFTVLLAPLLFACQKQLRTTAGVSNTQLPVLYKTTDSTLSNNYEDRTLYYYNLNGNCDSVISQLQLSATPPFWSYMRLRYEYTSSTDSLPAKIYRIDGNSAEYLYSLREYNSQGKLKKYSLGQETFRCTYDVTNRLIVDSQFNSFNVLQHTYNSSYDPRGNVIEWKTTSAFSPNYSIVYFTYDTFLNPFNYKNFQSEWHFQHTPLSVSLNNITSQTIAGSTFTITYRYNADNLPFKAYYYKPGEATPYKIRTYFYQ